VDILDIRSFGGKNVYSLKPVIRAEIDIGELYDTPTKDICDFNRNITSLFPGLKKHFCSLGYEGGFLERLREGTYLAHVTEHLILELEGLAGYEVTFGRTRLLKEPSVYYILLEYVNEKCAVECLITGVNIINELISGRIPDAECMVGHIRRVAAETDPGPSTMAIFKEARSRNIPVSVMTGSSILRLGCGKHSRLLEASLTDSPCCISVDIAGNKYLTKQLLSSSGIPVPCGEIAYTEQSAIMAAGLIGYPVVVKPFDANQGKGVSLRITGRSEMAEAFREAIAFSRAVIVEKYITGRDFRVLLVGGRVAAVAERIPPFVTGDGRKSIKQLVERENNNPLRGDDHEKPLTRIRLDNTARQVLLKDGRNEDDIPAAGEKVFLRHNGNLSTGGTARDCTSEIHPYNAGIAVRAAELLDLDIAGIDITAENISEPIGGQGGAVIEVNAAPGLRMHLYPTEGEARNVAADILDMLYPEGKPCTVPIVAVTGTNGKTTTTRLIAYTLMLDGKLTGVTTTSGIYIGNECILKGDNTGPASAGMVLADKRVEAAVLETARGGIVRKGLGYDLADVGVITNISEDHLGMDGINTVEELAMVKALVIEAVKPHGYAVLNADDGMTPFFLGRVNSKVILFSQDCGNALLKKHEAEGGKTVYVRGGFIWVKDGAAENRIIGIKELPIAYGGAAACNIENSLAAVSALTGLGIPSSVIRAGLKTFRPDKDINPGRLNIFDLGDFKVMLDYGHNPAGYEAIVNFMQNIGASRYVGVIGMPGDRTDKSIRKVGSLCGRFFSRLYIKEDSDLRGREAGEVAQLLYDSAVSAGMEKDRASIILPELKAFETAIADARQGDLIVLFYEEFEPALELLEGLRLEMEQGEVKSLETAG
jgi:cyanophycin synthetase